MDKAAIRLLVQKKIGNMSEDEKKQESERVYTQLKDIIDQKVFETIVTYEAFSDEVDISRIIDWGHNK